MRAKSTSGAGGADVSRYYDIVVGNAAAGDTLAICDYLDQGNGEQLIAALVAANAATPKKSVFVRRGVYNRGAAGSTGGAVVVPAGVLLVGDGSGAPGGATTAQVIIQTPADPAALTTKGIQALDVSGEARDISVSVVNLTSTDTTGLTYVVVVRTGGVLRDAHVNWAAITTPARLGSVVTAILQEAGSQSYDCDVSAAPADGASVHFASLQITGASAQTERFMSQSGGGYGIWLDGAGGLSDARVFAPVITDAAYASIAVLATTGQSCIDVQIGNVTCLQGGATGNSTTGILIDGTDTGSIDNVVVTNGRVDMNDATSAGAIIQADGAATAVVARCTISGVSFAGLMTTAVLCQALNGALVDGNGVINSLVSRTGFGGVDNIDDANFRTGGNY